MLGLSYVLGEHHKEKKTDEPFESGIPPTGDARLRFSSNFYIIAMFFVIFDLDAAFIMLWAVSFRELGLPWLYWNPDFHCYSPYTFNIRIKHRCP